MKRQRWSQKEIELLKENLGKRSFSEIGKMLGRSELAVQLYVHRARLCFRPSVKRNLVIELLRIRLVNVDYFTPTTAFIKACGLAPERFWSLYRGECRPTDEEYLHIAGTLGVTLQEAFESRQLTLFGDDEENISTTKKKKG